MTNKIEITEDRIVTRDDDGNILFDTDNIYIRTNTSGNMSIGGWTRQNVYSDILYYTEAMVLEKRPELGQPYTFIEHNGNNTHDLAGIWPTTAEVGYYAFYVPAGVTNWLVTGDDNTADDKLYYSWRILHTTTFEMGNIYYKKYFDDDYEIAGSNNTIQKEVEIYDSDLGSRYIYFRNWTPSASAVAAAYALKGEGYYKVEWLPSGWATGSFPYTTTAYDYVTGITNYSSGSGHINAANINASYGYVLPDTTKSPIIISAGVTP